MTKKQQRFADEWLIDSNATQAAIRAGYSKDSARQQGQRLLTKADIKQYIDERLEQVSSEKIADAKEIMEYLTSVVRGESESTEIVVEGSGDGYSEARTMIKKPSEKDRLKAAELIGKRFKMWTDNVNLDADIDADMKFTMDYGDGDADVGSVK